MWRGLMTARLTRPWSQPTTPPRHLGDDGETGFNTGLFPTIPGAYPDEIYELAATECLEEVHELPDTSVSEMPDTSSPSPRIPVHPQPCFESCPFLDDDSDITRPKQEKSSKVIPEPAADRLQDSMSISPSKPTLIAVFGMPGTGKSSFIGKVTGTEVKIGHGLHSCTFEIQEVPCRIGDRDVTLVDTPGFGDTERSEAEILQRIASWLMDRYEENTYLTGVIYLHRISDPRMTESSLRNLTMLRKLCGTRHLSHVILATTMWDKVSEEEGSRREAELVAEGKWWGDMQQRGAIVRRYDNTKKGATALVKELIGIQPFLLEIQREIGVEKKSLIDTAAGKSVLKTLNDIQKQHEEDLRLVKEEMQLALQKSEQSRNLFILSFPWLERENEIR
ncbi:hypothetical protein T310_2007 [Rasamsonia emersonii CBS 393.64]|uniref:G domain-containing protein n=1 Tax=Rasamsonia emersonii (strain ATCC 16479 / CBS 393.64 / IMI 116815) TaxID=1408163 RepID=A0A0F4Z1I9_RASE3|nr:hypothetical protein T310_2007 [Rasamsonia emersonii CBS 393.64]KKA23966.1 hypothetical protein T310_2007 [Rasamsonia emersonii CBS 393.64]